MKSLLSFFHIYKDKKEKKQKKKRSLVFDKFFERKVTTTTTTVSPFRKSLWILTQYLIALFLTGIVLYIKIFLDPILGKDAPFLFVFTAILISGLIGGFGPAFLSTLLCAGGLFYLFLSPFPFNPFVTINPLLLIQIIAFIVEGTLMSLLLEARIRNNNALKGRIAQEAAITNLSYYALASSNLTLVFAKAADLVTQTLEVKYCKILELLPGKKNFILRAGVGWRSGLVGHTLVSAGMNSQGGYTLLSEKPIIVKNLPKEKRFYTPELLSSHGVISGLSVIIPGRPDAFGILGVHSEKKKVFTSDDIYFVQAIANILATAIERNLSEKELRDSQERFKKLFDSNIIGAFISTFSGKFLEANDAFLNLLGYSREELREGKIQRDRMTPPEYDYLSKKAVEDLREKGESGVYEKEYIHKSGKRIPVLIAVSRISSSEDICVGFILDISKQKELERRKDEFISVASHELKTPVTSLKVYTQFLKQKFTQAKEKDSLTYATKMDKQVNKLTDLINDLLDITKIQAGKLELHKELFNLNDLVEEIVEDMQAITTSHTIKIQSNLRDAVMADKERIGQVLTNLLTNAIKYSPKGSQIIVHGIAKEKEAIVGVQDFGIGIDKKYQHTIFQQFFRINEKNDETYPGLGMGLFISSEIIKRHQGKIWVESEGKKGSTFYFSLPLPEVLYENIN